MVRKRGTLRTARSTVDTRRTHRKRVKSMGFGLRPMSIRNENTSEHRIIKRSITCVKRLNKKRGMLQAANILSPISMVKMKLKAMMERLMKTVHAVDITNIPCPKEAMVSEASMQQ